MKAIVFRFRRTDKPLVQSPCADYLDAQTRLHVGYVVRQVKHVPMKRRLTRPNQNQQVSHVVGRQKGKIAAELLTFDLAADGCSHITEMLRD